MNKITLIGNLTRDPELTQTASGVAVGKFTLAVNRPKTSDGEQQTDFFNCTAWRAVGENIARYSKKGEKLAVIGSVQLRNYEDNQGVKRTAVDIIVTESEFLTPKTSQETPQNQTKPFPSVNPTGNTQSVRNRPVLTPVEDDGDIPF